MLSNETEELVDALEERGLPQGLWLVQIAQVRQSLQAADALMRRLETAIIRSATPGGGTLDSDATVRPR
jgi:hypothetical protein